MKLIQSTKHDRQHHFSSSLHHQTPLFFAPGFSTLFLMLDEQRSGQQFNMTTKVFQLEQATINYSNIKQSFIRQEESNCFEVHNFIYQRAGSKFVKITEVLFHGEVLKIQDEFEFKAVGEYIQNTKQTEQREKLKEQPLSFGRRNNYSDPNKDEKSDTKNLIKNIMNLFKNWLGICNTPLSKIVFLKLKKQLNKNKYFNRTLIQELCKDKQVCAMFIQFYQKDSETAIENSRIKDKNCHLKAIKIYTKLFQESLEKDFQKGSSNSTNS